MQWWLPGESQGRRPRLEEEMGMAPIPMIQWKL
jgi:hypothetical protein